MLIGIFGTGRNGSTLISRLLDGLEDTYVHPVEEKFLTAFDDLYRFGKVRRLTEQNCTTKKLIYKNQSLGAVQLKKYFNFTISQLQFHIDSTALLRSKNLKISPSDVLGNSSVSLGGFLPSYLENISKFVRPDKRFKHYAFKSIEGCYIEEYADRFPGMKFIHVVRDPFAVCASQMRSILENKKMPLSYLGFDCINCMLEKRWVPHVLAIKKFQGSADHIVVRYEDLVSDANKETLRVAEFLGLRPPIQPTRQTIFHNFEKSDWESYSSVKSIKNKAEVTDYKAQGVYDEVLDDRDYKYIYQKTYGLLDTFGYTAPDMSMSPLKLSDILFLRPSEFANSLTWRHLHEFLVGLLYRRIKLFLQCYAQHRTPK